jgi:hypothetical protein
MIENFFTQEATVSRLQSGLLGPHLPAVANALDQMGYSPGSIRLHLRAADRRRVAIPGCAHGIKVKWMRFVSAFSDSEACGRVYNGG